MTIAKKILITTQTREIFIVRAETKDSFHGFCGRCGCETELLTLDQAVSISGISPREIFRLADANSIHAIETDTKHLLICLASMAGRTEGLDLEKAKMKTTPI